MSSAGCTCTLHKRPTIHNGNVNSGTSTSGVAIQIDDDDELPEIIEEDRVHKHCAHPTLPKETTIVIDIELLQDNTAPSISSLADSSEPQKPNTARIYLCHTCLDARDIFQRLGLTASQRYVETMIEHGYEHPSLSSLDKARAYRLDKRDISLSYDPRRLFEWLRIEPGETAIYWLPAFSGPYGDRPDPTLELIIQHQISISSGLHGMYSVVWFDFSNLYFNDNSSLEPLPSYPIMTSDMITADLKRWFAYCFYHSPTLHCVGNQRTTDFPALLILDLLKPDLDTCDEQMSRRRKDLPVRPVHASYDVNTEMLRAESFAEFHEQKALIAKMEGLKTYASCLTTNSLHRVIDPKLLPAFQAAVEELGITMSFLLSHAQRHQRQRGELSALYAQVAQGRQASSMSALTYCAALFLPLSLAATFLSMQNRARDIGIMTCDFLGLGSTFTTIAAIAFTTQKSVSRIKLWKSTEGRYRPRVWHQTVHKLQYRVGIFYGIGWLTLLVTFLLGMFHQSRTVPFVSAAVFAFLLLSVVLMFVVVKIYRSR